MSEAFSDKDLPVQPESLETNGTAAEIEPHQPELMKRERFMPYASYLLGELVVDETMTVRPSRQLQPKVTSYPRPPIRQRQGRDLRGRPTRKVGTRKNARP